MTSQNQDLIPYCARCKGILEVCASCDRPDCPHKVCNRCLRVELGQSMEQPHDHDG